MRAWVWRVVPAGAVWRAMFVVNGLLWASAASLTAGSCVWHVCAFHVERWELGAHHVERWEYGVLLRDTVATITLGDLGSPFEEKGSNSVWQQRSATAGAALLFSWETHRDALGVAGRPISYRLPRTYWAMSFPLTALVGLFGAWPMWRIWRASVWRRTIE